MPVAHSPVTDNSLLVFAQTGAIKLPDGVMTTSGAISFEEIFENGFAFGGTMTRLRVHSTGEIQFGTFNPVMGVQWAESKIIPFALEQDTRLAPSVSKMQASGSI